MFNWFKKLFKKEDDADVSVFRITTTLLSSDDFPVFVDFQKEKKVKKQTTQKRDSKGKFKKGKK